MATKTTKSPQAGIENMTKEMLKERLDQKGISYTSKASKSDLITLLSGKKKPEKKLEEKKFGGEY